jgi:hypothetical protein
MTKGTINTGIKAKNINWKKSPVRSTSLASTEGIKCYVCKLLHAIYRCPTFISLTVSDRINKVVELKLCKICLRQHPDKNCMSRNYFKCAKPHNSLLHYPRPSSMQVNAEQEKK